VVSIRQTFGLPQIVMAAADLENSVEHREHVTSATTGVFDADKFLEKVGVKTAPTSM
jgi:hypothetical protein